MTTLAMSRGLDIVSFAQALQLVNFPLPERTLLSGLSPNTYDCGSVGFVSPASGSGDGYAWFVAAETGDGL